MSPRAGLIVGTLGSVLVLGLLFVACGDKEQPLTIPPFSRPSAIIQVDDTLPLKVELNRTSNEVATVDIIVETLTHTISLDRSRLVYQAGEQSKTVIITGRADSEGGFARIRFTIAENGEDEIYRVKVEP